MIDETTAGRRSVCLIPIRLTCPTLLCIYAIGQLPWSSAWLRMTLQNAREAVWRPRSSKTAKNCLRPLQALHGALRASIPHVGRVSRSRERCLRPSEHRRVPRAAPKNRIASALDGFYPLEQTRLAGGGLVWEMIARRYRCKKAVWGYDLVNEPVEGVVPEGLMGWHALATATARKIRQIDPDHAIIIEPGPWGGPQGLDWFEPLDVPGIVYSVHMYAPFQFTHQGIYGNPTGISYPGEVDGKHWDKEALRRVLKPAIDYQRDYGVHIYLGEFSAIRWAPGDSAHNYLRDCIEIFEEQGWDWAYHAFREWDGWSVEHGPDRNVRSLSSAPTKREQLLRAWFQKNFRRDRHRPPR